MPNVAVVVADLLKMGYPARRIMRDSGADLVARQHECGTDGDPVGALPTIMPLADGWLPRYYLRSFPAKSTRRAPMVWHSASSRSDGSVKKPAQFVDGARILLAHNTGSPTTTRPTVSYWEGPAANGS